MTKVAFPRAPEHRWQVPTSSAKKDGIGTLYEGIRSPRKIPTRTVLLVGQRRYADFLSIEGVSTNSCVGWRLRQREFTIKSTGWMSLLVRGRDPKLGIRSRSTSRERAECT